MGREAEDSGGKQQGRGLGVLEDVLVQRKFLRARGLAERGV
jgi:hypothetical protein